MGRIVSPITITNALDVSHQIQCDILVDTGADSLILPKSWKPRLGKVPTLRVDKLETAEQRQISGEVCGPVRIQIKGFKPIYNEVTFIDMESRQGKYEPLLGCIILEQSQAIVDMKRHRLAHVKYAYLKTMAKRGVF